MPEQRRGSTLPVDASARAILFRVVAESEIRREAPGLGVVVPENLGRGRPREAVKEARDAGAPPRCAVVLETLGRVVVFDHALVHGADNFLLEPCDGVGGAWRTEREANEDMAGRVRFGDGRIRVERSLRLECSVRVDLYLVSCSVPSPVVALGQGGDDCERVRWRPGMSAKQVETCLDGLCDSGEDLVSATVFLPGFFGSMECHVGKTSLEFH